MYTRETSLYLTRCTSFLSAIVTTLIDGLNSITTFLSLYLANTINPFKKPNQNFKNECFKIRYADLIEKIFLCKA
jgi:hypothetical protein